MQFTDLCRCSVRCHLELCMTRSESFRSLFLADLCDIIVDVCCYGCCCLRNVAAIKGSTNLCGLGFV